MISQFHRLQPASAKMDAVHFIGYQPASAEMEAVGTFHMLPANSHLQADPDMVSTQ